MRTILIASMRFTYLRAKLITPVLHGIFIHPYNVIALNYRVSAIPFYTTVITVIRLDENKE